MTIVGTLGPESSFSEKAAKQWQKKLGKYSGIEKIEYFEDIADVIAAVANNKVDFAIIPIENSVVGSIADARDLLEEYKLKIVDEEVVKISHCLLANSKDEKIIKIMSHEKALAQCRKYLKLYYPGIVLIPATSTSAAAAKASRQKGVAAIASCEAAEKFDLEILAENIQDQKENYTRFVVVSNYVPVPSGNDKTSIIVWPKDNNPGALYEILGVFALRNIDLTTVESRPTTNKILGQYLFHIDFKGHINDKEISETLEELKRKVKILIVLGSYPAARINGL